MNDMLMLVLVDENRDDILDLRFVQGVDEITDMIRRMDNKAMRAGFKKHDLLNQTEVYLYRGVTKKGIPKLVDSQARCWYRDI